MVQILHSEEELYEVIGKPKVTVLHIFTDVFNPCALVTSLLDELKQEPSLEDITFVEVAAEEANDFCDLFLLIQLPTIMIFRRGLCIDRIDGYKPDEITRKITAQGKAIVMDDQSVIAKLSLEEKLKQLINKEKVMLFMKGTPDVPRCGYCRKVVRALKELKVEFGTFDVLEDEEVRQGLKSYSDWKTYPQLYANGELIGGHDIIVEMFQSGELGDTLKS